MGNVSGNTFTASENGGEGDGWLTFGDTTVSGDISGNTFIASMNGANGYGWYVFIGDVTVSGNVSGNTFTTSENSSFGATWVTNGGDTSILGNVSGNTFTVSDNDNGYGWLIATFVTVSGDVSSNTFTISDNAVDNTGIFITMGGQTATFEGAIMRNRLIINGSLSGDYGFTLDTSGGGEIDFNGNSSESELISSNNDASVSSTGSDINYNG